MPLLAAAPGPRNPPPAQVGPLLLPVVFTGMGARVAEGPAAPAVHPQVVALPQAAVVAVDIMAEGAAAPPFKSHLIKPPPAAAGVAHHSAEMVRRA